MTRKEHLLIILMEECAEIQKECAKALRFGLHEFYAPDGPETNAESITRELGDLAGIYDLLLEENYIQAIKQDDIKAKKAKIEKFLKYSKKVETYSGECNPSCTKDMSINDCQIWETSPQGCTFCPNYIKN